MDLDELHRLFKIFTLISFTFTLVVLIGELAGWWHDFGEFSTVVGVIVTVLVAAITLLLGASKGQVHLIAAGVLASNVKLDSANGKLDGIDQNVAGLREDQRAGLDRQMEAIDRAFDEEEEQTALLEEQAALERQQTELLRDIRDRLPQPR